MNAPTGSFASRSQTAAGDAAVRASNLKPGTGRGLPRGGRAADRFVAHVRLGLDVFDCAIPTRLARHGTALVPDPAARFRLDLRKGGWEGAREPIAAGCPCPACGHHDRDYISYLSRAEELTAVRLLCLHNLTYLRELVTHARTAIVEQRFDAYSASILAGAAPWDVTPISPA